MKTNRKQNRNSTDRRTESAHPINVSTTNKRTATGVQPNTPGPWAVEEDSVVFLHWQYSGCPNFGRIVVTRLDPSWPQGDERKANASLIVSAVNACLQVNPNNPQVAATILPRFVRAVGLLSLEAWRCDKKKQGRGGTLSYLGRHTGSDPGAVCHADRKGGLNEHFHLARNHRNQRRQHSVRLLQQVNQPPDR